MRQVSYGRMLSTKEVIEKIDRAIVHKRPFALVRVGDGENIVLAQRKVMKLKDVVKTRWGSLSRKTNRKGISLPNIEARDRLVKAIKRADVVGIPHYDDEEIQAPQKYLRSLTDKCFRAHNIHPTAICHTFVNRHMVERESFWQMLRGRRVVIISRWAKQFAKLIDQRYGDLDIKVVKKIDFDRYRDIKFTIDQMQGVKCDVVLVSAGVNAVILATELKRKQGRVALDFGKAAMFMVTNNTKRVQPWRGGVTL